MFLKETFKDWSHTVDINGYNKIFAYESNLYGQIPFILIFLASTFFTCWLVVLNVNSFLSYDVISKSEVIHERPTQFPTLTICDLNLFESPQARLLIEYVNQTYNLDTQNPLDATQIMNLAKSYAASSALDERQKKNLGFNLEQNIEECTFGGSENCLNNLTWYYSYDYGNCYQFNLNGDSHAYFR